MTTTGYVAPAPVVGSKWTPGYRPAREIAADIRRDLKQAQRDGMIPADLKVSVRTRNFAGGRAIDVNLTGWDYDTIYGDSPFSMGRGGMTPAADRVYRIVERIRESYNRDASDSMVDYWDVDYYGSTTWL